MKSGRDLQPVVSPDRVVVLANDVSLVEHARVALEQAECEVRQASGTGIAAMLLSEWQPDVAIVDFDMDQGRCWTG